MGRAVPNHCEIETKKRINHEEDGESGGASVSSTAKIGAWLLGKEC